MARVSDGAQFDPCPVHVSQATWQRAEETGRVALSPSDRGSIAHALDLYVSAGKRFTDSATFGNICEPLDEVAKAASGFQKLMRKLESMPPRSESGANGNTTLIKAIGTSLAAFLDEKSVSLVVEKAETQLKAARSWETRLYGALAALAQVATLFARPDINGTIVGSKRLLDLVAEITKFSKGLQRALDGLQRKHARASGTAAEYSAMQSAYRSWHRALEKGIADRHESKWDEWETLWPHILAREAKFCEECALHARNRLHERYGQSRTPEGHVDAFIYRVGNVYASAGGTVAANKKATKSGSTFSPFVRLIAELLGAVEEHIEPHSISAICKRVQRLKAGGDLVFARAGGPLVLPHGGMLLG